MEVMSDLTERLLSYLKQNAEMINSQNRKFPGKYKSDYALILDNGIVFEKQTKSPVKGQASFCYQNCYEMLCDHPDLHYCEGFAIHESLFLPLIHAWLINDKKEVVDPTWLNRGETAYFGLVFNKDFITKRLTQTQSFAIIESDYKRDYEMLKNGFTAEMLNQQFYQF